MALALEFFDADGAAVADGVFLPLASLPGVVAAELAAGQSALAKEAKALMAILERMYQVIAPSSFAALGFTVTKSAPTGVSVDASGSVVNQSYSVTWQKVVNLDLDVITLVPVPTAGNNLGVGDFSIADVFPSAAKVAAAANTGGAGVLVRTSGLTGYSSLTHAGLDVAADGRAWFAALADHFGLDAVIREAGTQTSAIIDATAEAVAAIDIPAAYVATTDPTSAIPNINQYGIITRAHSYTVQLQMNPAAQTFDVRVA